MLAADPDMTIQRKATFMRPKCVLFGLLGVVLLVGSASAGLLWEDGFDDKNFEERWTRGDGAGIPSGWQVEKDKTTESNIVEIFPDKEQLDGRGESSFAFAKEMFIDFAWVMDIQVLSEPFVFNIGLLFRVNAGEADLRDNFYELELLPTGFARTPNTINWIRRNGGWENTEKLLSAPIPIPLIADQWYQTMVVAEGNSFTFYVKEGLAEGDFTRVSQWTDDENLNLEGTIGFHMVSFMHYLIDNVKVFDTAQDAFSFLAVESKGKLPIAWGELKRN